MTVKELTRDQLNELKSAFFWQEETMHLVPANCWDETDIPDELIFEHYANICFVDDDFFCSANGDVQYMAAVPCVVPF